jgi:FO synthase subunit 1
LEDLAAEAGVPLRERLPVYERFLRDDDSTGDGHGWVSRRVRTAIAADTDAGRRYRSCLSGGDGGEERA